MNHGSTFTGIGGFDLAAEWVGWQNIFHCEINKYCQAQLKTRFPNADSYADIRTTNFRKYRHVIDVLSGGDPCQPHSVAGLGKGKTDDRYLWPEFDRAIDESQPPWVVNENVSGSVSNGVLDIKISDLEKKGYTCQPYYIPAEAVGALHQRERIWLVAYNADFHAARRKSGALQSAGKKKELQKRDNLQHFSQSVDLRAYDTDNYIKRLKEQHFSTESILWEEGASRYTRNFGFGAYAHGNITGDEIKSGIIRMLNGLPEGMDYADRNQRIKALGNAIVPQIAYEIFKLIDLYELLY